MDTITFNEALDRAKHGKFNCFVILLSGVIMTSTLLETTSVAFFMPVAECELNLSDARKGLLSAIAFIGIITTSHMWGFLCDTKGRKRVMKSTLLVGFAVTFVSSFAKDYTTMLILRFISGICISAPSATIFAYIGEVHTDGTRARAMRLFALVFAVGGACMPIIAFSIINSGLRFQIPALDMEYKAWRLYIVACGVPGLIGGVAMFFLPESPKFFLSMNRQEEAKEALQQIYRINGGKDKLELPKISLDEDEMEVHNRANTVSGFFLTVWDQTAPLFRGKYLRCTLIISITQFWLFVITNGFYLWFPFIINAMTEFRKENPGENKRLCEILYTKPDRIQKIGFVGLAIKDSAVECPDKLEDTTYLNSLALELSYVVTFAFIALIADCVGNTPIMVIVIVVCGSCGLVAVMLPHSFIATIFFTILLLVGVDINILGAITIDLYPTKLRAMAMAVSLMLGRIGVIMGTMFVGALISTHCELTFYIGSLATMSCAVLILFLPRPSTIK